MNELFHRFATSISRVTGSPFAFACALLIIALWSIAGSLFRYSDSWQLVINTATTIITFLMVFLIQNTQNRDAKATHLKLDELLKGVRGARTGFVDIEELSDEELDRLHTEFRTLHQRYAREVERRAHK